ncbi:MAG: hypothetical protein COA78_35395 [Blastopirellula sp.]|nr:MAG: hypothetical protein COA78_35395 [Blastopirellula sp.]
MIKSYEKFRDAKAKTGMSQHCILSNGMAQQLSFAAILLDGKGDDDDDDDDGDDDSDDKEDADDKVAEDKDAEEKDDDDKDADDKAADEDGKEEDKEADKDGEKKEKTEAEKKKEAADVAKRRAALLEKMIMQGLKEVAMHEVGHTLGLRHNFKASKFRTLEEANDPKLAAEGMVASVMDYVPANVVPKGKKQGDFFPQTIGPYDIWAIQYGYTPMSGGTTGEKASLLKIAARSGEAGHAYATDEDTTSYSPDPDSNRFDFGQDPLKFANQQATLVQEAMDNLVDRVVKDGDDYTKARRAFNILLSKHGQAMFFVSRYIGGLKTSRSHKGDKDGKLPFEPVDVKMQRDAMKMLEEQVFSDAPYNVDPAIYNHLGPNNWSHWGTSRTTRPDFPIHDYINMWQDRVLTQLLSYNNLDRMHDTELKIPADEDAFTTAELIERLTDAIFSEVNTVKKGDYTNRKPAISSLRRNLQRTYMKSLSNVALGNGFVPQDAQTVAYYELGDLQAKINKMVKNKNLGLDTYTKAHLKETSARIKKVLEADLTISRP